MPLSPQSSHFTSNGQLKTDRNKPKYYGQSSNNNSGKSQNSGTNNKESHYNTYRANNFGDQHNASSQRKNQVEERNDKSGEKQRGTVEKLLTHMDLSNYHINDKEFSSTTQSMMGILMILKLEITLNLNWVMILGMENY